MSDAPDRTHEGRRLTLLPEVLPAPGASVDEGTVRQRTLQHLGRMVAAAAATAALTAACTTGKSATGSGTRRTPDGAKDLPVPPTQPPPTTRGYQVVDPVPPPAMCSGLAASIAASAVWESRDGALAIRLTLGAPTLPGGSFAPDARLRGFGRIYSVDEPADGSLVALVAPADSADTSMDLLVPARCLALQQSLGIGLELGEVDGRVAGAKVPVRLYDTFR